MIVQPTSSTRSSSRIIGIGRKAKRATRLAVAMNVSTGTTSAMIAITV